MRSKLAMVFMLTALFSPSFLMLSAPSYAQEQTQEVVTESTEAASPEAVQAEVVEAPTQSEWSSFLEGLGGVKGATTLAIVALVVQGLMLMAKTGLGQLAGKAQLLIVTGLTLVGGVLALKTQGMDWASVLVHSSTLTALQVFAHQLYKQFAAKND